MKIHRNTLETPLLNFRKNTDLSELFGLLFSRKWLIRTTLVVIAMIGFVRLGIWQLDRLSQRRAFNTRVLTQMSQPTLILNAPSDWGALINMEYRKIQVKGEYDHSHEIALRNQYSGNQWGVHLVTPLRISGTNMAILVDRGWIPGDSYESGNWSSFNEPGIVEVIGVIRREQSKAEIGNRTDPAINSGDAPRRVWNFVNIDQISKQIPYPILSVYIQQSPNPAKQGLPIRSTPDIQITEGPHLGYAIQWFTFALIAGIGYLIYFYRQVKSQ